MQKARSHRAGGFQYLKPYKRFFESGYRLPLVTKFHDLDWLSSVTNFSTRARVPSNQISNLRFETTVHQQLPYLQILLFEKYLNTYFRKDQWLLLCSYKSITGNYRLPTRLTSSDYRLPSVTSLAHDGAPIFAGYRVPEVKIKFVLVTARLP